MEFEGFQLLGFVYFTDNVECSEVVFRVGADRSSAGDLMGTSLFTLNAAVSWSLGFGVTDVPRFLYSRDLI